MPWRPGLRPWSRPPSTRRDAGYARLACRPAAAARRETATGRRRRAGVHPHPRDSSQESLMSDRAFARRVVAAMSLCAMLLLAFAAAPAFAAVKPYPASITGKDMPVSGGTQYVRTGGKGPAVLLLHGFGDTGDMWQPLAEVLLKDHRVIIPDLRGMGLSSHPEGGYEKAAQARDLAAILDALHVDSVQLVTHDIGNM